MKIENRNLPKARNILPRRIITEHVKFRWWLL